MINKFMKLVFLLLPLVITSCSKAPKCSDNDVVKLATQISQEARFKAITGRGGIYFNAIGFVLDKEDPGTTNIINKMMSNNLSLEELKESKSPKIVELVNELETNINAMELKSIRTSSVDDSLKKCGCEADLILDKDNTIPIKFTAQKTDEGKTRVDVSFD